jgi:hypothetical protein
MTSTSKRLAGPRNDAGVWALAAVLAVLAVGLLITAAAHTAHWLTGGPPVPANPAAVVLGLATKKTPWPVEASWALGAYTGLLLLLILAVWLPIRRASRRRSRVDHLAQKMGTGRDLAILTTRGAQETADQLQLSKDKNHPDRPDIGPGLPIAITIAGGQQLWQDWESVCLQLWGPRKGKALPAATPVLTPHGWVPIKDLARGCRVIGADGRPTTVTGVYPQGIRPAYRMHLSDGTSIVCDPGHLWTVRPKIDTSKKRSEEWRTWTTQQLLDNGLRRPSGGARYYLPIVKPVQFEGVLPEGHPVEPIPPAGKGRNVGVRSDRRKPVPVSPGPLSIDPYLLGVLIGDGGLTGGSVMLSTGEPEDLLPLITPLLPPGVTPRRRNRCDWALTAGRGGYLNPLIAALRSLGPMGHSALTKFIPEAYLLADVDTRWALLQGLMDTDGSIDVGGQLEFSTSSPQLSDDFRFLVQSLGGTVTTTRRETTHAPSYRSHLRLPTAAPAPFQLPRKRDRWQQFAPDRRRTLPVRAITAIEPEGEAEMVCISVAAPDGLFVTEHCIVTHNTSTQSIRRVLAAPGAVVATTNKAGRNEVTVATREHRAGKGTVWIYDPQGIGGEAASFYWNPLGAIRRETRDKVGKAKTLSKIFTTSQREHGARPDAYFDPAGQNLIANFVLAAAVGRKPDGGLLTLLDVYGWLTDFADVTPIKLLEQAGYTLQAKAVRSVMGMDVEQKGGIYGTAEQTMAFLTSEALPAWITPTAGGFDIEFDPHAFVRSTDTLYLLSKEGEGSTGPLITALTAAVVDAAVAYARTCPGGRLPLPMVVELDEAANICRWVDLPDLYSHFGSQGILVTTYLQSYAQGEAVWGREGMRKLWSAANIAVVGPGVREVGFLRDVSEIVGDHEHRKRSTGHSHRGGSSTNYTTELKRTLPVSELANLPPKRLVVLAGGMPPALCRPVPWWETEHEQIVKTSQALHDPSAPAPALAPLPALPDPVAAARDVPAAGADHPWTDKEWP